MKTYSEHHCGRAHRTRLAAVKCAFPRFPWIAGDPNGEYAVFNWTDQSISLRATYTAAEQDVAFQRNCAEYRRRPRIEIIRLPPPDEWCSVPRGNRKQFKRR